METKTSVNKLVCFYESISSDEDHRSGLSKNKNNKECIKKELEALKSLKIVVGRKNAWEKKNLNVSTKSKNVDTSNKDLLSLKQKIGESENSPDVEGGLDGFHMNKEEKSMYLNKNPRSDIVFMLENDISSLRSHLKTNIHVEKAKKTFMEHAELGLIFFLLFINLFQSLKRFFT